MGNNSLFANTQLQNSLYIHNNSSGQNVTLSDALISGNFVDRYVNLNGKLSITPNQIPAADASYTKISLQDLTEHSVGKTKLVQNLFR